MNTIAIIMGSDSDLPIMKECFAILDGFGVSYDAAVLSAHRTPDKAARFAKNAKKKGIKVIIAGAGGAAHLAGVVASHTTIPVIGVPLDASSLNGMDALLATVQMPAGIPVATVAVGKAGATNAALLAVEILALSEQRLAKKLVDYKKSLVRKVEKKNKNLSLLLKKNKK